MEQYKTRLRELRQSKGLTQEQVRQDLNYTLRSYQDYERGQTSIPQNDIPKIAFYFGVTADYLLYMSDEPQPQSKQLQEKTGISEIAIANISKCKHVDDIMSCINIFLSSNEFINAMESIAIARTPAKFRIKKTDEIQDNIKQGYRLFDAVYNHKSLYDEQITLTGQKIKDYEHMLAKQNISNLIDRIVKGEDDK